MRTVGFVLLGLTAVATVTSAQDITDATFFTLSVGRTEDEPGAAVGFTVTYTNNAGVPRAVHSDVSVHILSAVQRTQRPDGTAENIPAAGAHLTITGSEPGRTRGVLTLPPVHDAAVTIQATLAAKDGYNTVLRTLTREQTVFTTPSLSPSPSPPPPPRPPPPPKTPPSPLPLVTIVLTALAATAVATSFLPRLVSLPHFFALMFWGRKRKDRWWLIVDSDLGKPIAGAIVQVFDAQYHKLRETQVTGKDGQCGFLLPTGTYYVLTHRAGFAFPPTHQPPLTLQKGERFYTGGNIAIDEREPEKLPHLIIPMDREEAISAARIAFRRIAERIFAFVDATSLPLLLTGAALNTALMIFYPGKLNIAFEVLYAFLFALKLYLYLTRQKGIGAVVDTENGSPIDLAAVRLYERDTNRIVQTRVTNPGGRFFILVPRGTYTISVAKAGYETLLHRDFEVSGRQTKALSLKFQLRKKPTSTFATPSPSSSSPPPVSAQSS
jgi:hypothetical protein